MEEFFPGQLPFKDPRDTVISTAKPENDAFSKVGVQDEILGSEYIHLFPINSYQEDSKEFVFQLDKSILPKYFTLNDIRLSVNLSVTKKENGSQAPLTIEDNIAIQVISLSCIARRAF